MSRERPGRSSPGRREVPGAGRGTRAARPGAAEGARAILRRGMEERAAAGARFFENEADRIARLCHRMAERFARGGRLVALGDSPQARSDTRHVAVEFVHPVIVGKRALPALGLTREAGPLPVQVDLLVRPDDVVVAFGLEEHEAGDPGTARAPEARRAHRPDGGDARGAAAAVDLARERGCLTIGFAEGGAEWAFPPPVEDPFVRQELVETLYHVLWELVHVFFEHRGLLEGRRVRRTHDVGGSRFLYPFLGEQETDLEAVVRDVARSVLLKSREVTDLRRRLLDEGGGTLIAAAAAARAAFDRGGTLLAFGDGGSATDAMDLVADLRAAPGRAPDGGRWPGRPALDLTEDASILTAIGNDVGMDATFSRQVIAYGREDDVAFGFSTSGSSRNVVRALEEARRRGLRTTALVGYDGGEIGAGALADHVIVAPSENIPRIQEAHATAYHLFRTLVEAPSDDGAAGMEANDPSAAASPGTGSRDPEWKPGTA